MNLQCDLAMLGKQAFAKVAFREQMEYLKNARDDDLAVVFSYRGVYFDYDLPYEGRHTNARVWLVTGNSEKQAGVKAQGILSFESRLDFALPSLSADDRRQHHRAAGCGRDGCPPASKLIFSRTCQQREWKHSRPRSDMRNLFIKKNLA